MPAVAHVFVPIHTLQHLSVRGLDVRLRRCPARWSDCCRLSGASQKAGARHRRCGRALLRSPAKIRGAPCQADISGCFAARYGHGILPASGK